MIPLASALGSFNGDAVPLTEANAGFSFTRTGWYSCASAAIAAAVGGPPGAVEGILEHQNFGNSKAVQIYRNVGQSTREWIRRNVGSGFTAWTEVFNHEGAVGTVSQSGGIPVGAIVESGSNSSGYYVRWLDGTQFCSRRNWIPDAAGSTWTFPAAFNSQATTSVLAVPTSQTAARSAAALSTGAGEAVVRLFDVTTGMGVASGVSTFAAGRWFA